MSRPSTATVDYFPHIVKSGKTIYVLEMKFGNDGYAAWFKILEQIGATDGHYVDCRDLATWEYLVAKCRVDEDKLMAIILTLSNVGAIDRELWSQKVIFCQNFLANVEELYKRRTVAIPTKEMVIRKLNLPLKDKCIHFAVSTEQNADILPSESDSKPYDEVNCTHDVDINPQTKVKKSIEEESITTTVTTNSPEEEKKETGVVVYDLLLKNICQVSNQIEADLIGDWIETMPRDWITEAIRQAALAKAHSIKYVDKILQAWVSKYGLRVEKPWEVEADGKDRKNGLRVGHRRDPTPDEYERDLAKPGW